MVFQATGSNTTKQTKKTGTILPAPVLINQALLLERNNFGCTWAFLAFSNFILYLLTVIQCCITVSLNF